MCRDPRNSQRLFDIATLPDRITVTDATSGNAGELRLTFAPDGHRGRFDTGWLRSHCYSEVTWRERQFGPRPWGKELMDALPAQSMRRSSGVELHSGTG